MPPDPKLGSFFVTPWPTSWILVDVLDVLRLRARCLQAMLNFQILDIFDFPRARPLDLTAHALIKGTKRRAGASSTYFSAWVGHTHLKILQTMPQTRPHQESFEKNGVAGNFMPDHTVLLGRRAVCRPLFFQNVPECALNHLHYFSVL